MKKNQMSDYDVLKALLRLTDDGYPCGGCQMQDDENIDLDELLDGIRIYRNDRPGKPVTTVIWGDGSKTMIRACEGQERSDYFAFTVAFTKRILGSNSAIRRYAELTESIEPKPEKDEAE